MPPVAAVAAARWRRRLRPLMQMKFLPPRQRQLWTPPTKLQKRKKAGQVRKATPAGVTITPFSKLPRECVAPRASSRNRGGAGASPWPAMEAPLPAGEEMQRKARAAHAEQCGLQSLNNLLQAPAFSAVDLDLVAEALAAEILQNTGADIAPESQQGGYGLEPLRRALEPFGLELVSVHEEGMKEVLES